MAGRGFLGQLARCLVGVEFGLADGARRLDVHASFGRSSAPKLKIQLPLNACHYGPIDIAWGRPKCNTA
jgi:hypothetical protein